jgi:hypothetical protein
MSRLRAGTCKVVNPYGRQIVRVSLRRQDVDGFVFWTKNVGPFLRHLPEIRDMEFPFVVQHGINGYPRALETSVIDSRRSADHAAHITATFGTRVLVWRYDTIVVTSLTPPDFHIENFGRLAERLRGSTDEVVISFMQDYGKTRRNLDEAARRIGFTWRDPDALEKRDLAAALVGIAKANGMQLTVCSQRDFVVPGAAEARCIDAERLADVSGAPVRAKRKGNRQECDCFESRDIGEYDTCPHGCVYCYAVQNRQKAFNRYRAHDPASEFLFEPEGPLDADTGRHGARRRLGLFRKG